MSAARCCDKCGIAFDVVRVAVMVDAAPVLDASLCARCLDAVLETARRQRAR